MESLGYVVHHCLIDLLGSRLRPLERSLYPVTIKSGTSQQQSDKVAEFLDRLNEVVRVNWV
jgi:hypothetical protein